MGPCSENDFYNIQAVHIPPPTGGGELYPDTDLTGLRVSEGFNCSLLHQGPQQMMSLHQDN